MIHQMTLLSEDDEQWKEFWCEICNRRLLLRFTPYGKAVINKGDEKAAHAGSYGPLRMGRLENTVDDRGE